LIFLPRLTSLFRFAFGVGAQLFKKKKKENKNPATNVVLQLLCDGCEEKLTKTSAQNNLIFVWPGKSSTKMYKLD